MSADKAACPQCTVD